MEAVFIPYMANDNVNHRLEVRLRAEFERAVGQSSVNLGKSIRGPRRGMPPF